MNPPSFPAELVDDPHALCDSPYLPEDPMICLAAAPPGKTPTTDPTAPPSPTGKGVRCCSCERRPACLVLTWPDTRFAVCRECVSPAMATVAEPLDVDDELLAAAAAESA